MVLAYLFSEPVSAAFSEFLGIILKLLQVGALFYAGYKFTRKPHDSLEQRVSTIENRQNEIFLLLKDIQKSLDASHEKHRSQDKTNKVFKKVMLLLANFEVAFCQQTGYEHTEDLIKAKAELDDYLTGDHL